MESLAIVTIFIVGVGSGAILSWYILKTKFDIEKNSILNESNIKLLSLQNQLNLQISLKQKLENN